MRDRACRGLALFSALAWAVAIPDSYSYARVDGPRGLALGAGGLRSEQRLDFRPSGERVSTPCLRAQIHLAAAGTSAGAAYTSLRQNVQALQDSLIRIQNKLQAGFISGMVQATVFHPWDRALYLAQTTKTSFLDTANWAKPFQGIRQTLLLRVLSASIFFPLEETMAPLAASAFGGPGMLANFVAGNAAGGLSAALMNPIQAVRYKAFSLNAKTVGGSINFISTAQGMAQQGGARALSHARTHARTHTRTHARKQTPVYMDRCAALFQGYRPNSLPRPRLWRSLRCSSSRTLHTPH